MPNKVGLSNQEVNSMNCFMNVLLSDAEKAEFGPKFDKISDEFGYRCNFGIRSSAETAIRMYILSHSNLSVEDVADLSTMDHEQLMGYIRDFTEMMDTTVRDPEECARDLAATHKAALEKILNYEIPEIRTDNMEYLARYQAVAAMISNLYIDFDQDCQQLRYGEWRNKDMEETKDGNHIRRAYEQIYDFNSFNRDVAKLGAYVSYIAQPIRELFTLYENGDKKTAALYLDDIRFQCSKHAKKQIMDLPVYGATSHLYGLDTLKNRPFPGFPDGEDQQQICEKYLKGESGNLPISKAAYEVVTTVEEAIIPNLMADAFAGPRIKNALMESAIAILPQDPPDNLLKLSDLIKNTLEQCYHNTLGQYFKDTALLPIDYAGLTPFDLIKSGDRSISEIVGDKYDKLGLSPEEKLLAMKLEVIRELKNNPDGLTFTGMEFYIGMVDGEKKVLTRPLTTTYTLKTDANVLDFKFDLLTTADSGMANSFLGAPDRDVPEPIRQMGETIEKEMDEYFACADVILKQNHMDRYDCIFIENKTVNEIYIESYAHLFPNITPSEENKIKNQIIAAESFRPGKDFFVSLPIICENAILEAKVLPVTFSGKGVNFTIGQNRTGSVERVRERGKDILNKRIDFYQDKEKAKAELLEKAAEKVNKFILNPYMLMMDERIRRIESLAQFTTPINNVFLKDCKYQIDLLMADIVDKSNEYETYMMAAKLCNDPEIKASLLEHANTIKGNPPFVEYENYVKGMEFAYGLYMPESDNLKDNGKLDSFFLDKLGYPVLSFIKDSFTKKTQYVRPLEVKIDLSGIDNLDKQRAADFVHNAFSVAKLGFQNDPQNKRFGKFVLVNGRMAEDLFPDDIALGNLSTPQELAVYERTLGEIILKALKKGQKVDIYPLAERVDGRESISTLPIHVVSTRPVTLTANEEQHNAEVQENGRAAILASFQQRNLNPDTVTRVYNRLEANKEVLFREKVSDSHLVTEDIGYSLAYSAFMNKYFNDEYPVVANIPNPEKGAPTGQILAGRGLVFNYIMVRLALESINAENELDENESYSLDEIINLNALEERKRFYAEEFKEICQRNDTRSFNENIIKGLQALLVLFNREYNPEDLLSEENYKKIATGRIGMVLAGCCDLYQELMREGNKEVQDYYNLYEGIDKEEFLNQITFPSYITQEWNKASGIKRDALISGITPEKLQGLLSTEYIRQGMAVNHALGRNIFHDTAADRMIGNSMDLNGGEDFYNSTAVTAFMQDRNRALSIIARGEFFNYIYFDVDGYLQAKQRNYAGTNINDYIKTLNPNDPEEKQRLEKAAIERRMDRVEKEAFDERFSNHIEGCKNIFERNQEDDIEYDSPYKYVEELSDDELDSAGEIFDDLFGRVLNREAAQEYLQAHRDLGPFGLLYVRDTKIDSYINHKRVQHDPPQAPLNERQLKAEILRIAFTQSELITYKVVRKEGQQPADIKGTEYVLNPSLIKKVLVERPYLAGPASFKTYATDNHLIENVDTISNTELQNHLTAHIYDASRNLFAEDRITTVSKIKEQSDSDNPVSESVNRIQTIFAAKPVFVDKWAEYATGVYTKDQFTKNLKDLNSGSFNEKDFATLALLASMNLHNVVIEQKNASKAYPDDSMTRILAREMKHWTTDFLSENPGNLGKRCLEYVAKPAREAASRAIVLMEGKEKNNKLVVDILLRGIRTELQKAVIQPDILNSKGEFYLHAEILKRANDILDEREELKNLVLADLSEQEMKDFECVLKIRQLNIDKNKAVDSLEKAEKGEAVLNEEQINEYRLTVSDFNNAANLWKDNYLQMVASPGYETMFIKMTEDLRNNLYADRNSQDAIAQEKELYLSKHLHVADSIYQTYLKEDGYRQFRQSQNNMLNQIEEIMTYLGLQILRYKTNQAIPVTDNDGRYIFTPENIANRAKEMAQANYCFSCAIKSILERLPGDIIQKSCERFNAKHPDNRIVFPNNQNVMDNDFLAVTSEKALNEFFDILEGEMAKQAHFAFGISDDINAIRLPNLVLENTIEPYVTHNYENTINTRVRPMIAGDDANREEKNAVLNEVNSLLYEKKEEIKPFLKAYNDIDEISKAESENQVAHFENYMDGAFRNNKQRQPAYYQSTSEFKSNTFINPDCKEALQEIHNHPKVPGVGTRTKIANVVKLMEQYGMIPANGSAAYEDGNKIYGYQKLMQARNRLITAVNQGTYEQIKQAKESYVEERLNMRDVFRTIKEFFPNAVATGGNLESSNSSEIPLEFSKDSKTESIMNGLFLLACQAKKSGLSIDEFLQNPIKGSLLVHRNLSLQYGFDRYATHYSTVADTLNAVENDLNPNHVAGADHFDTDLYKSRVFNSTSSSATGFGRPIEVIAFLEEDPELKAAMNYERGVLTDALETKTQLDGNSFRIIKEIGTNAGEKLKERFKTGLKAALLEGGLLRDGHLPNIKTDEFGVSKPDEFNYQVTLRNRDTYQILINIFNQNLASANQKTGVSGTLLREAMEAYLFDYLTAHPEDMEKREYKTLETFAFAAARKLNIQTNRSAEYSRHKERFIEKRKEILDKLKKDDDALNDKLKTLLSEYRSINERLGNAQRRRQNTTELQIQLDKKGNEIKNLCDGRIIELSDMYQMRRISETYLRTRYDLLNSVKQNFEDRRYRDTEPDFFCTEEFDLEQRIKDTKVVVNLMEGTSVKTAFPDIPEYLSSMKNYREWRLHEDPDSKTRVRFKEDLSPDEWTLAYRNAVKQFLMDNTPLPDGIPKKDRLLVQIDERNAEIRRRENDEKFVSIVRGNRLGVQDAESFDNNYDGMNGMKVYLENMLFANGPVFEDGIKRYIKNDFLPENKDDNPKNKKGNPKNKKEDSNDISMTDSQVNDENNENNEDSLTAPKVIVDNDDNVIILGRTEKNTDSTITSIQNENTGKKKVVDDEAEMDPFKQDIYSLIADVIAAKIIKDRDARIPGGNTHEFANAIARDNDFKKIVRPMLILIWAESNKQIPEGQEPERKWTWRQKLIDMIEDRSIVNAYTIQKNGNAKRPGSDQGVKQIMQLIRNFQDELQAREVEQNQPKDQLQGQPNPQPNPQPNMGGPRP